MLDTSECISSRQSRVLLISPTTKLFIEALPPSEQISASTFSITTIFHSLSLKNLFDMGRHRFYLLEGRITLTI